MHNGAIAKFNFILFSPIHPDHMIQATTTIKLEGAPLEKISAKSFARFAQ